MLFLLKMATNTVAMDVLFRPRIATKNGDLNNYHGGGDFKAISVWII